MNTPKTFRPWNPQPSLLLLPSSVDRLPQHQLMFFRLDLVAELDLSVIVAVLEQRDRHGFKAYNPRV